MLPLRAAAFALLLGLHGALGDDLVPAPENVMVQCSDHRPRVSWNYGPQGPDGPTNFTVKIGGSGKSFQKQTLGREFDLSDFVWSSEEQMFEYMFVQITATQGANRSRESRATSFSYNRLKTVDVTCHLLFPPVSSVSDSGSGATVTFPNPLHFYEELKLLRGAAVFRLVDNGDPGKWPPCKEADCKYTLDFPQDSDFCVNLTGIIKKNNEEIQVLHPEPVCATAPSAAAATLWLIAGLSVVVLAVVIGALTTAICKVQAWVFPKTPTPQALVPNPRSQKVEGQSLVPSYETRCSLVHVSTAGPDPERPSPECEEDQTEDRVLIPPEDLREDAWYGEYQEEAGESTRTETVSMDSLGSDEIPATNYERRTRDVNMDLDGDVVKGYTA